KSDRNAAEAPGQLRVPLGPRGLSLVEPRGLLVVGPRGPLVADCIDRLSLARRERSSSRIRPREIPRQSRRAFLPEPTAIHARSRGELHLVRDPVPEAPRDRVVAALPQRRPRESGSSVAVEASYSSEANGIPPGARRCGRRCERDYGRQAYREARMEAH